MWLDFIQQASDLGYPAAVAKFDKPTKKVFQDRLRKCQVTFWKPQNLLDHLGAEIAKLHPDNFNFS